MPRLTLPRPLVLLRPLVVLVVVLALVNVVPELALRARAQGPAPSMLVEGKSQDIVNGDSTPTTLDGTDFGSVRVDGTRSNTFYVENVGNADLTLTATPRVTITGSAAFSVTIQPTTPIIPGGRAPFSLKFAPTSTGTQTATVSIDNNDPAANPYVFTVQGTGFIGPAISLDLTVGLSAGCSVTSSLRVAPGTTVNYCYRVINTGTVTVTLSSLTDTAYGNLLTDAEIDLAPDGAFFYIVPQVLTETITITNTATWTASNPGPVDVATASDTATVVAEFEAPAFTSGAPPTSGTYASAYSFTFSASGLPPPSFSVTAGSLPPGLSLNSTTGVLTGTLTAAGTYPFTVTAANGVAPAATRQVTVTVARVPLTITADNKTISTGQTPPPLTASYSGFLAGDTPASLDTPVKLSTTATSNSSAGTYPIIASGAADANYTITFVPGTLTVNRGFTYLPRVIR
jgi:MBG domain (YGX type)/Putative Ig domain/Abnormal spindle-like microcephaly-assoc'd, ASPM-SPD-2-Hydin